MHRQLGIVMDDIAAINPVKDSSFAMLLAAQRRGWTIHYFQQRDLFIRDGQAWGQGQIVEVMDDTQHWFTAKPAQPLLLGDLPVIFMRKDPPFDMEYIMTTYLLELAEQAGSWVVNRPQGLRDANEKLFTAQFPDLCPPTLVSRDAKQLKAFCHEHEHIVVKPVEGMGGQSIFRLSVGDPNINVILETITHNQQRYVMAQRFIPEIKQGDKRILIVAGQIIDYALARIPTGDEFRGNLAVGGRGQCVPLSQRDYAIAKALLPRLEAMGLWFVGIDVIGDYLTEVNVTSPTCIRELDKAQGLDIAGQLMDAIEKRLTA